MKKSILLLLTLIGAGCTPPTESSYVHQLNAWLGHTPEELTSQWGTPTQVIPYQNTLYYIYTTDRTIDLADASATGGINEANALYPIESPQFSQADLFCETTFVVQNDIITDWSFDGNSCVSR